MTGRVVTSASSIIPILEPVSVSALPKPVTTPIGAEAPPRLLGSRPPATLPSSTMIGELKLTSLKARLTAIGVQAELVGEGVLICGGGAKYGTTSDTVEETVAVRKTGTGKVELEGNVSDVYYVVRREIYALHALIAA